VEGFPPAPLVRGPRHGGGAMKRIVFALAVLLCVALTLLPQARSQVPTGPGDKGAVLRQPWLEGDAKGAPSAPAQPSGTPSYLHGLLESSGANRVNPANGPLGSLQPYDTTGLNNDILVRPEMGQWLVLITSYRGKDGPMRARKMVYELRRVYQLHAYVFNFGAEEKRRELERVAKIIEHQKAKLKEANLPTDQPIRVSHINIDEYVGVLVAGYPTMEAARKARDDFRTKLKPPDPSVFKLQQDGDLLDTKYYVAAENNKAHQVAPERVFVNPFDRAFPVHNPTIKMERPTDANQLDVAALRHMNSAEDLSLLKCPKNFTLVIKQFNTPTIAAPRNEPAPTSGLWDSLGFGKKNEHVDFAAENAHRLAEALRKSKLEAYVLHMKYCSLVTVGGFDSMQDANMLSMKNFIETRLVPQMTAVELFPQAMAWQIPR
jgi:hypothetical protein